MKSRNTLPHWLLTCCVIAVMLLTACDQHNNTLNLISPFDTATQKEDEQEALERYRRLLYYYNHDLNDSLFAHVEDDMQFDLRHGAMRFYYNSWWLLVNTYTYSGKVHTALLEVKKMHTDASQRQNNYGMALSNHAMGIAYDNMENRKEAVKSYLQGLKLYPRDENPSMLIGLYYCYCTALNNNEDYETAAQAIDKWKDIIDSLDAQPVKDGLDAKAFVTWNIQNYMARFDMHMGLGQYNQAANDIDSVEAYNRNYIDSLLIRNDLLLNHAKLNTRLGRYEEALKYCNMCKNMRNYTDMVTYTQWLTLQSEIHEGLGEYHKSLTLFKELKQVRDSINQEDTRAQLNELNTRFQVDELKLQNQIEHSKSRVMFFSVVGIALFLFAAYWLWTSRKLRKNNHELTLTKDQLSASNAMLEQKNAELLEANRRAEEASRMKTAFMHQISHEIRTPLNILSGFTQMLTTSGTELDEATKHDVNQQITENAERITKLVEKMLELSDINSQSVIKRDNDVPALQIAVEAVGNAGLHKAKHINLHTHFDETASNTILHTHLRSAKRALALLLDNAQKFSMPPHNPEETAGETPEPKTISLSIHRLNDTIAFTVEDNGQGIPADEAEHIFEEFVQLNNFYPGTGIGLPVARSLARRLGGDIVLDTSYTDGARFVMTLPITD